MSETWGREDVLADVSQKADPMANGHDLDPETGEGICSSTGKQIEAETMSDLTEDCPHCGEPLSMIDAKADLAPSDDGALADYAVKLASGQIDPDTKEWQQYTTDSGNTAWYNPATGERRYQSEKPVQESGEEEDAGEGGGLPDDGWESASVNDLEEGDWASFTSQGETYAGRVTETSDGHAKFEAVSPERVAGETFNVHQYRDNIQRVPADGSNADTRDRQESTSDDDGGGPGEEAPEGDSWEDMNDAAVRQVIDELYDESTDGAADRREIYEEIGTPPLNDDLYEDAGLDPMAMASTTSDVATEYGTVAEFEQALESGALDDEIEETYRAMEGEALELSAQSEAVQEAVREEVRNHVVFDLIFHHPMGRSDDLYGKAEQKAEGDSGGYGVDVFRVLADPEDDTEYDGDVLGIGVDFPESDVYVDWRREAFPDPLDDPHVSIYGSIEDLEEATQNVIEYVERYQTAVDVAEAEGAGAADGKLETHAVSVDRVAEAATGKTVHFDGEDLFFKLDVPADTKEWLQYETQSGDPAWYHPETAELRYQEEKPGGDAGTEESSGADEGDGLRADEKALAEHAYELLQGESSAE